jgi:hypothetical protein
MGKADKLKQGAKKTGYGLFKDMTKLNAVEEEKTIEITDEIQQQENLTEEVKENTDVEPAETVAETVAEPEDEPAEQESEMSVEEQLVAEETVREEATVHTDDDSKSRRPVETVPEPRSEEPARSEVLDEILKGVTKEPVKEPVSVVIEAQPESDKKTEVENAKETQVNKVVEDVINDGINNVKDSDPKPVKKQNSRYEKDKFLLLDIRGYRDYIEHIAKAANMSATKYIRSLIEQDMEKNKEIYLAHKKLEEMLRGKNGN